MKAVGVFALAALVLSLPTTASAAPVVFEAAGTNPEDIEGAVNDFREFLGPLNPNVPGSFQDGRREINWDGVPDAIAAPNLMPPDFFNVNSPRGAVFFTPGTGFQISADNDNPTHTPILFGNLLPAFTTRFRAFSQQRLFTALRNPIVETLFFEPGSTNPATVDGFGVVFSNVNLADSTTIEYFDAHGRLLFGKNVLRGNAQLGTFSFLGVGFDAGEQVYMVRVTSGNRLPVSPERDIVMMDDFIYAEPQPVP